MNGILTIDSKKCKKGGDRKFSQRILAIAGLTPTKNEQPGTPRTLGYASPQTEVNTTAPVPQEPQERPSLDKEGRVRTFSVVGGEWRSSALETVPSLNPDELQTLLSSVAHHPTSRTNVCMEDVKREKLGRHDEALKSHPPFDVSAEVVGADGMVETAQASSCDEDDATLTEDSADPETGYATSIESAEPVEPVLSAGGESLASTDTECSYGPPVQQVLIGERNIDRKGGNRLVHMWGVSLASHKASSKLRKRSLHRGGE